MVEKTRVTETLGDRLDAVRERIVRAAQTAGRHASDITLVAVTKVFPASAIQSAFAAGLRDFGENYVQEFEAKYPEVAALAGARFHLIGHLQSNKARRAAELFHTIQTLDTPKLARNLWLGQDIADFKVELPLTIKPHETILLKITQ